MDIHYMIKKALRPILTSILTSKAVLEEKKMLKSVLGNFRGRVLDVGCGEFINFLGFIPGDKYIGLDIIKTDFVSVIGNSHFLPFKDNSFDNAICTAVLEHVENPKRVIEEIYRVLRGGGEEYT